MSLIPLVQISRATSQLAAFVREVSRTQEITITALDTPSVRQDVRIIMDVFSKRGNEALTIEEEDSFLLDLQGLKLSHVSFHEANFSHANLTLVNMSSSDLQGGNFSHSFLFNANFSGTDLCNANFSKANLHGANLSGANLSGAKFSDGGQNPATHITQEQLDSAASEENNPPILTGAIDHDTGRVLSWSGGPWTSKGRIPVVRETLPL